MHFESFSQWPPINGQPTIHILNNTVPPLSLTTTDYFYFSP